VASPAEIENSSGTGPDRNSGHLTPPVRAGFGARSRSGAGVPAAGLAGGTPVLQGMADEVPFAFLAIGLEDGAFRDGLDDGAADVRFFPEIGLVGRDLELDRLDLLAVPRGGEGRAGEKDQDQGKDDRLDAHGSFTLMGLYANLRGADKRTT